MRATSRLNIESLEARDVPSGVADNFESATYPYAPGGWSQWSSTGSQYYQVNRTAVLSGTQSVAVFGNTNVESRIWQPAAQSGDVSLSLAVRADAPAPILLFGRGSNLNAATANSLGVSISGGGKVELRELKNGVSTILKTVTPTAPVAAGWLRVTMELTGTIANVRVQRLDNQQFLNNAGAWQAAAANAMLQTIPLFAGTGLVGVGRLAGNYGTAYIDDFSATPIVPAPPTPPPPPPPAPIPVPTGDVRKFDHIRIAQLAYAGQNVGAVEAFLFNSTVDLVVSSEQYLDEFEAASAGTPKAIYSNVTNLYGPLLADWLQYADSHGVSREQAFYHVAAATPFIGSSPSSTPVTWFTNAGKYNVAGGSITNITTAARGTQGAFAFGQKNEVIALGGLEKYREINVSLSTPAGSGYAGVWEYASGVDSTGKATQWKTLPTISNLTNNLTSSGRLTFNPPVDWVSARLGATGDKLYYVRFRTTAATSANAPIATKILGRDYVGANGGVSGTIPAFDNLADLNGDKYLTDAEYANRRIGFHARFNYESRLFYPNYGQMRFVVNPTFDAVKQWEGEYHADLLAANPLADALFLDNTNGKLPITGINVLESTTNYAAQTAATVAAVKAAIDDRIVLVNTTGAETNTAADGVTKAAGIAFEEFLLRPTTATWSRVNDIAAIVNRRLGASPTTQVVLDSHPGSASILDARTRMGALSYYYLVADPDRTYLMFFGGFAPTASWQSRWVPAAAMDVGDPTAAMTIFASGFDPSNSLLQYKVFGRQYQNALVLYKPLSYTLGKGTGTLADNTATTHNLNGNYRLLNADGSLGNIVTTITLRNGEGAVLMKV